jgi:hypothetical protein
MKHAVLDFWVGVYMTRVYVADMMDNDDLTKFIKSKFKMDAEFKPGWYGKCVELTKKGDRVIIIALNDEYKGTPGQVGTIAHESFHAAEYILESVGIDHHDKTSEAFAYLIGHICASVHDILTLVNEKRMAKRRRGKAKQGKRPLSR